MTFYNHNFFADLWCLWTSFHKVNIPNKMSEVSSHRIKCSSSADRAKRKSTISRTSDKGTHSRRRRSPVKKAKRRRKRSSSSESSSERERVSSSSSRQRSRDGDKEARKRKKRKYSCSSSGSNSKRSDSSSDIDSCEEKNPREDRRKKPKLKKEKLKKKRKKRKNERKAAKKHKSKKKSKVAEEDAKNASHGKKISSTSDTTSPTGKMVVQLQIDIPAIQTYQLTGCTTSSQVTQISILTNIWDLGRQVGAEVIIRPSHHCNSGSIFRAHTWIEIRWSQSDSEGFSPGYPVFLPPHKSTFTPKSVSSIKSVARALSREIG